MVIFQNVVILGHPSPGPSSTPPLPEIPQAWLDHFIPEVSQPSTSQQELKVIPQAWLDQFFSQPSTSQQELEEISSFLAPEPSVCRQAIGETFEGQTEEKNKGKGKKSPVTVKMVYLTGHGLHFVWKGIRGPTKKEDVQKLVRLSKEQFKQALDEAIRQGQVPPKTITINLPPSLQQYAVNRGLKRPANRGYQIF